MDKMRRGHAREPRVDRPKNALHPPVGSQGAVRSLRRVLRGVQWLWRDAGATRGAIKITADEPMMVPGAGVAGSYRTGADGALRHAKPRGAPLANGVRFQPSRRMLAGAGFGTWEPADAAGC